MTEKASGVMKQLADKTKETANAVAEKSAEFMHSATESLSGFGADQKQKAAEQDVNRLEDKIKEKGHSASSTVHHTLGTTAQKLTK